MSAPISWIRIGLMALAPIALSGCIQDRPGDMAGVDGSGPMGGAGGTGGMSTGGGLGGASGGGPGRGGASGGGPGRGGASGGGPGRGGSGGAMGGGPGGSGGDRCVPGSQFQAPDGCNVCVCPDSTRVEDAACTERACEDVCTPGEWFAAGDGCNECQCPATGRRDQASCTLEVCDAGCDDLRCGDVCQPRNPNHRDPSEDEVGGHGGAGGDHADGFAGGGGDGGAGGGGFGGFGGAGGHSAGDEPPPAFQCNVVGDCVPAPGDEADLQCNDRCAGIECGDPCRDLDASGDADEVPSPANDPVQGLELCRADGRCVTVDAAEDLRCPSAAERCEPGEQIPALDGCNSCVCPESGLIREGEQCTEAGCEPEEACAEVACGEVCEPNLVGTQPAPSDEDELQADPVPNEFHCNVFGRCVSFPLEDLRCAP